MAKHIYKNSTQFEKQRVLKAGIQKSWSDDQVKNLISRIYELIQKKGKMTHYKFELFQI